ncbi:hypothetical protein [Nonomuraea cavernae]|uniref:Uncharacterized protein n=1 Tax=Nonomuraea cavernae TaxID=2045107 RepID=A0A918DHJ8_9ACTN|nr:hypothetical protein [Nonomuraea cavernae]MCA2190810.1 hypothetical protein [Nonomuraea cavernae]GGO66997.1 hypothetical protein GCM10012289_22430 [Nonomuraea cavernae]
MTSVRPTRRGTARADAWIAAAHRNRNWLWLVSGVPTAVLAGLIMLVLPPQQTLGDLADWAFRLSPFVFGVVTVALLPLRRFGPPLLLAAVVFYMGVLDTGLVLRILPFGAASGDQQDLLFQTIYQWILLTVTFVVLFALLGYRMGGARTTSVLKLGLASVLVVISGLNDLTFWLTYDWPDGPPSHLHYASHIIVFTGGPPSIATAVVFMVIHLALAVAVLSLPLGRYVDQAVARHRKHTA